MDGLGEAFGARDERAARREATVAHAEWNGNGWPVTVATGGSGSQTRGIMITPLLSPGSNVPLHALA